MTQYFQSLIKEFPWLAMYVELAVLFFIAWCVNFIFKRVILHMIKRASAVGTYGQDIDGELKNAVTRLTYVLPAIVIMRGVNFVQGIPADLVAIIKHVAMASVLVAMSLTISSGLNIANIIYNRRSDAYLHSIKGYLQLIKLVLAIVTGVMVVAVIIDRSPMILLSGLGAMAAVLMLVFQDTILSFVASVQISSNDMVRLGDWVEIPHLDADGAVIDIALHTIKVQNWDNTITTIPTRKLMTDSFKNWRGMQDSGGRRIKRSLYIDQNSVRFLTEDEKKRLARFDLLKEYLETKHEEISKWNTDLGDSGKEDVNTRRMTNLGTFRIYVERFLRAHPLIRKDMTLMVRQLSPQPNGIPIEIYCFSSTTVWVQYEGLQADIFDHLLAILSEFGLLIFQNPGGLDMRSLGSSIKKD